MFKDSPAASVENTTSAEISDEIVPRASKAIEDEDTAKASMYEEHKSGFSWWWLLILAAISGVSVEEYNRRKNAKEKAQNNDNNITQ